MVFPAKQVVLVVESAPREPVQLARLKGRDRLLHAHGLAEAVGLLGEFSVDVVLLAVEEDLDRAERFVRWLKVAHPRLPVLVTSPPDARTERRVRQWPVAAYLARPVVPALLARVLDDLRWSALVRRVWQEGPAAVLPAG
jgi:AmiR/NasT family two-component response regulator